MTLETTTRNPARIVRYADERTAVRPTATGRSSALDARVAPDISVRGVRLTSAPIIEDLRGNLSARETGKGLPFTPSRYFTVFDVPSKEVRGEHAHRECEQFLVCLRGSVSVVCDDGAHRQEFELGSPEFGLYLPPNGVGCPVQVFGGRNSSGPRLTPL
jgi:UDP-2-acetamido-3-amino-2,3-dideoxy-glucuronate N-acetyltransferase